MSDTGSGSGNGSKNELIDKHKIHKRHQMWKTESQNGIEKERATTIQNKRVIEVREQWTVKIEVQRHLFNMIFYLWQAI